MLSNLVIKFHVNVSFILRPFIRGKQLWLTLAERHLDQRGIDWKQAEKLCFNEWSNPDDEELGIQIVKVRQESTPYSYAVPLSISEALTFPVKTVSISKHLPLFEPFHFGQIFASFFLNSRRFMANNENLSAFHNSLCSSILTIKN